MVCERPGPVGVVADVRLAARVTLSDFSNEDAQAFLEYVQLRGATQALLSSISVTNAAPPGVILHFFSARSSDAEVLSHLEGPPNLAVESVTVRTVSAGTHTIPRFDIFSLLSLSCLILIFL